MIFAAAPPRASTGSLEATIAIASAARVKDNFSECFMSPVLAKI
jgi:hypothetical protein